MKKTLFCVDPASGPELEKEGIFSKDRVQFTNEFPSCSTAS